MKTSFPLNETKNFNLLCFFNRDNIQGQGRIQVGPFTVAPATGILINTGFVPVTIEYAPEAPGKHEEEIFIDITDREFTKSPNGIVYRLTGEACYPSIVNSIEIFEEHTIIPNITVLDPKLVSVVSADHTFFTCFY